jgi:quercetin dioxygenase-like cupin family protein
VIHSHDAEQVIVVMEGSMTVEVEGQRAIVEPGDAVVIPHGVVHQLHNGTALNRHLGICGRIGTKTILQNGEELTPEWQQ